ncbi:MAG TPA: molybdopterin converting factor subunit 1 [Anaerolineales bacterium]|nr:molybdopterin converting factor subunit 1 [Anaerolineales bacterium]
MRIRVLYFASLRQRLGFPEETLDLPEPATVADLRARLAAAHPEIADGLQTAISSVNREFALPEQPLQPSDEVAMFPPVSGGAAAAPTHLRVTEEPLDFNALLASIVLPTTGAACVFSGLVRGESGETAPRQTDHLEYEAYAPMAEAKLRQVADEIRSRWPGVAGIALVQRVGVLEAGTPTIIVACSGAHRDSGVFEAARYGIDRIKEIVPVWKKEVGPGGEMWVEGHYRPGPDDRR